MKTKENVNNEIDMYNKILCNIIWYTWHSCEVIYCAWAAKLRYGWNECQLCRHSLLYDEFYFWNIFR